MFFPASTGWGDVECWRGGAAVLREQRSPANGLLLALQPLPFPAALQSPLSNVTPHMRQKSSWVIPLDSVADNGLGLRCSTRY